MILLPEVADAPAPLDRTHRFRTMVFPEGERHTRFTCDCGAWWSTDPAAVDLEEACLPCPRPRS